MRLVLGAPCSFDFIVYIYLAKIATTTPEQEHIETLPLAPLGSSMSS